MDWPRSNRFAGGLGLRFLRVDLRVVGAERGLHITVESSEVANIFCEIPNGADSVVTSKVNLVCGRGDQEDHFAKAVELAEKIFGVKKPGIGQFVWGKSLVFGHGSAG